MLKCLSFYFVSTTKIFTVSFSLAQKTKLFFALFYRDARRLKYLYFVSFFFFFFYLYPRRVCKRVVRASVIIWPRSNEIYVRAESVSNSSLSSKTIQKRARKRGGGRGREGEEVGWFVTSEPACRVCSRCLPNAVKVHVNYRINLVSTSALSPCHVIKTFLSLSETSLQTEMPIISI